VQRMARSGMMKGDQGVGFVQAFYGKDKTHMGKQPTHYPARKTGASQGK
jgi:hypothetical protein